MAPLLTPATGQSPTKSPGDPGGGTPWFDDAITNPHSSDDGVDIGVPDKEMLPAGSLDNLITAPYPGTVIDASYHVYGGQVVVDIPGTGYAEYNIHLDDIYVQPGQKIFSGEALGTSGGGVGDLILKNGRVQPATSQGDYKGHSSGPHDEYGLFNDGAPGHPSMGEFNRGWGNRSRQLDPTPVLEALRRGDPLPKVGQHTVEQTGTGTGIWWSNIPVFGPILSAIFGDYTDFGEAATSGGLTAEAILAVIPAGIGTFFQAALNLLGIADPLEGCKSFAVGCLGIVLIGAAVVIVVLPTAKAALEPKPALAPAAKEQGA